MLVLPELQIEKILVNGFACLYEQIDMLDELLSNYPEEMRAEAKKYLRQHRVSVVLNWPREGVTLPVVAILNSGDSESPDKDVLGDFLNDEDLLDSDSVAKEMYGVAKQGTYSLICNSSDPRLSLYIGLFVETLLILNSITLQGAGLHNIVLNSGDLQFNESMLPEWVNARVVTLSCLHYHAVQASYPLLSLLVVEVSPVAPGIPDVSV